MEDHHRYNKPELEQIERDILEAGTDVVVMTSKDERNLPETYRFKQIQALVLEIDVKLLEQEEDYLKIIAPAGRKT